MPSPVGNIRGAQNKFHLPALVNPSQNLRLYLDLVNGSSNQNEKTLAEKSSSSSVRLQTLPGFYLAQNKERRDHPCSSR